DYEVCGNSSVCAGGRACGRAGAMNRAPTMLGTETSRQSSSSRPYGTAARSVVLQSARDVRRRWLVAGLLVALSGLAACAVPLAVERIPTVHDTSGSGPASSPGAATSAGPSAASAPPATLSLKLAATDPTVSLIPNSVLWLAKDLGFYAREGLD